MRHTDARVRTHAAVRRDETGRASERRKDPSYTVREIEAQRDAKRREFSLFRRRASSRR